MYTNFVMKFEEYFMINMGIIIYEYIHIMQYCIKKSVFQLIKNANYIYRN